MSRRYPLDPPSPQHERTPSPRKGWLADDSMAMRLAAATAQVLLDIGEWRRRHADLSRAIVGITLLVTGLVLGAAAAITDSYLHRGVESGAERPYIVQPTAKTLATNVDLRPFVGGNLTEFTTLLANSGIEYVRQEFSWEEIEPDRGAYDWARYDAIVEDLARRDIGVIAVVVDTPDWARPIGTARFFNSPPRDRDILGTFVGELAGRYIDRVGFVQLWNGPNLASQWGGEPATGATFAPYLEAVWNAAREANPAIRVVSPQLAVSPDVPSGQSDLDFLAELYDVGGSPHFDIVGIVLDGGSYSPDDRRVNATRVNTSRAILFRELMVSRGDAASPVWATSFGWSAEGSVSRQEQAEFVERGLERSWSEWPWMGLMVQWAFLATQESPDHAYAMVLMPDGVPTPLYDRLTSPVIRNRSQIANTGFMPMDFKGIDYSGTWAKQPLEGRTFRTTHQVGASVTFTFQGTGLIAYLRSGPQVGRFTIELDGELVPGGAGISGDEWDLSDQSGYFTTEDFPRTLVDDLEDTPHTMTITLVSEGELTLGGLEVTRQAPFVWPIVLMTVGSIISLFFALRSIAYLFATRSGHLRRPSSIDSGPPLPQLTGWRPGSRYS